MKKYTLQWLPVPGAFYNSEKLEALSEEHREAAQRYRTRVELFICTMDIYLTAGDTVVMPFIDGDKVAAHEIHELPKYTVVNLLPNDLVELRRVSDNHINRYSLAMVYDAKGPISIDAYKFAHAGGLYAEAEVALIRGTMEAPTNFYALKCPCCGVFR